MLNVCKTQIKQTYESGKWVFVKCAVIKCAKRFVGEVINYVSPFCRCNILKPNNSRYPTTLQIILGQKLTIGTQLMDIIFKLSDVNFDRRGTKLKSVSFSRINTANRFFTQ